MANSYKILDIEQDATNEQIEQAASDFPVPYASSNQSPSQIILTKINHELLEKVPKIQLKRSLFNRKVKCSKLFMIVLDNSICLYAKEKKVLGNSQNKWYLSEYFTHRSLTNEFKVKACPWDMSQIFDCNGILAIAYPAYLTLPISIIKNGHISRNMLRAIHPVIQTTVNSMGEDIYRLFQEEKEKTKSKTKGA